MIPNFFRFHQFKDELHVGGEEKIALHNFP